VPFAGWCTSIVHDAGSMRIVLKGTSGSGKTTLGRELARRLDAVFVELDALTHKAGWVEASDAELRAGVDAALAGRDRWVVDGNYDSKLGDRVLACADVIVWLDLPLGLKLWRVWGRTWRRLVRQETLWNGNRESWKGAFVGKSSLFGWLISSHFRHRREWPQKLAGRNVVRLCSVAEVERWLAGF
jgi:adenylate kinase family enzyme